ncbi:MAG: SIR2 family NAD-dependent protein deacylase [Myxococcota bacterium]
MTDPDVGRAAQAIANADALLVTAGAGMGVDSGLPDFRGNEGFWRAYPPFKQRGLSFVDMASPEWFDTDPAVAWGFYGHRLHLYRATKPHEGFRVLARWAQRMPHGAFVFTSNVDGQFQRAGFSDDRILECHGSIHHLQCVSPCHQGLWDADGIDVEVDPGTFEASEPLPRCAACGGMARPNVLMFGDWGWIHHRSSAQEHRFMQWLAEVKGPLAVVEMGAGTAIPTVRSTSEHAARRSGGMLIRINPREPQVPTGQIGIAGPAMATLQAIDEALRV